MSENIGLITVNAKKEYHDCEITFCLYYESDASDFKLDKDQKYKIHTTIEEVEILNEALHVYQADGFKKMFLLYSDEIEPSKKYPEFVTSFEAVTKLGQSLQKLAKDEDSLVQLQEYCLDTPPTYVDDFGINKDIESITINGKTKELNGYQDLKDYLSKLRSTK
ncbi:hypothetical protein N9A28_00955 [Sulfurimonas sp.]|nr:hypothetical protein [Sulfurimonas sp.]